MSQSVSGFQTVLQQVCVLHLPPALSVISSTHTVMSDVSWTYNKYVLWAVAAAELVVKAKDMHLVMPAQVLFLSHCWHYNVHLVRVASLLHENCDVTRGHVWAVTQENACHCAVQVPLGLSCRWPGLRPGLQQVVSSKSRKSGPRLVENLLETWHERLIMWLNQVYQYKMADDEDDLIMACCSTLLIFIASASQLLTVKRWHSVWVKRYLRYT